MKEIKLTNKQYDALKKICLIAVPIATCIMSVSAVLGSDFGAAFGAILSALAAAVGEIMQISTENYYSVTGAESPFDEEGEQDEEIEDTTEE